MNAEMKLMKDRLQAVVVEAQSIIESIDENSLENWEVGVLGQKWRAFECAADDAGFDTSASTTD